MKNRRALGLLLSANIVSGFAQGVSMLSIPWYFTHELNNVPLFGWAYGLITLATIFWGLYSGSLIDRYSRKKIFMATSLAGGIVLLSVALSGFYYGEVSAFMVLLVFATTIFIFNVHYPTLYAFGQEITEKQNYGRINSYLEIQGQSTTVLAGALAAILLSGTTNNEINLLGIKFYIPFNIEKWEMHEIFLMDAITYFIAILLISTIRYTPIEQLAIHTGKVIDRIKLGFNYLKEHSLLFMFGAVSNAIFVVLLTEVHLMLPLYVNNYLHEGADVYASAEIYYAFGALLAGIFIRSLFRNTKTVKAIIILMLATVVLLWICVVTKDYFIFFLFSAGIGITNAGTRILRITYLFNHIPNNYMGRTGSVFNLIATMVRSGMIALFSVSFFAKQSNVIWTYFICGFFVLFCTIPLMVKYKKLNSL